jgi:hypothetical protein
LRRLKVGLATLQREYSYLFTIQDEKWNGYHLTFRAGALGQPADGTIDVASGYVYLTVTLSWLLVILARAAEPLIVKQARRCCSGNSAIGEVLAAYSHRQPRAEYPPSTGNAAPVTKSDAELQRNTAAPARSSGSPHLPAGVRASTKP